MAGSIKEAEVVDHARVPVYLDKDRPTVIRKFGRQKIQELKQ